MANSRIQIRNLIALSRISDDNLLLEKFFKETRLVSPHVFLIAWIGLCQQGFKNNVINEARLSKIKFRGTRLDNRLLSSPEVASGKFAANLFEAECALLDCSYSTR